MTFLRLFFRTATYADDRVQTNAKRRGEADLQSIGANPYLFDHATRERKQ